ncbi:hypothetical protein PENTCL1PPCAC_8566 [Pristionchus entomophagus]|uniref:Uncharacterized protein n=1 Tax=Pristionchus entomophagus TaxID=358040 RepID=A0AAV5T3W3_9BILA|nr:hypothetical protein PENTCL1PPCAC_8566 [Pristionchus entomophagus]
MTEDVERLPEHVRRFTLMNGTKIYYRFMWPYGLYTGRSAANKEYSVGSIPHDYMTFAGELNNALFFYTSTRDDDDEDAVWTYCFYKCSCERTGPSPISFEKIGEKITNRRLPFALTQPYFMDIPVMEGAGSDINSFDGRQIMHLTRSDLEYFVSFTEDILYIVIPGTDPYPLISFDELAEINPNRKAETSIFRYARNKIIIDLQDDLSFHPNFGEFIYAQDASIIYLSLFPYKLLVINDDLEFESFDMPNTVECR